jgi:hypothetical protein
MAAMAAALVPNVQKVANVVIVAVVTTWFLSHLQRLADVKVRWGNPHPQPLSISWQRGAIQALL